MTLLDKFNLIGQVAIITGGAGLLGVKHAETVAELKGIPVLIDIDAERVEKAAQVISTVYEVPALGLVGDISQLTAVEAIYRIVLEKFGRIDILINNAANNPKMEAGANSLQWSRVENFPLNVWDQDIAVGLTGAFVCSRVFGHHFAEHHKGVILNIASDLSVIAPDQRIYRNEVLDQNQQPVKPITYSVVKAGLIGLTRYLSTYWAAQGVRVNAISPGGVYNGQDEGFVHRLINLIPMARMAEQDEYKAAVAFLISDASSYMTGTNLIIDGGRTVW